MKVFRVTLNDLDEYSKTIFANKNPNAPGIISMKAYEILKEIKNNDPGFLSGRKQKSIIGGVLYVAQFYHLDLLGTHITQKTISGILKITDVTVRNVSRKIETKIIYPENTRIPIIRRHTHFRKRVNRKYPPKNWFSLSYEITPVINKLNPIEVLRFGVISFIQTIVFGHLSLMEEDLKKEAVL